MAYLSSILTNFVMKKKKRVGGQRSSTKIDSLFFCFNQSSKIDSQNIFVGFFLKKIKVMPQFNLITIV